MYKRVLNLTAQKKSFFLWGQRQTGKSSLLASNFPDALYINLLNSDEFLVLASQPSALRERANAAPPKQWIIIDEVQKIPLLLDEVHLLIETSGRRFGLCGSSARKLKRGAANLLGGRAHRFELFGFCAAELGRDFVLEKMLNRGYLPSHYLDDDYFISLQSYVGDYLKEEILAEGLTRNLQVFSRFLDVAAIGDTDVVNHSNIARETGVSVKTAQAYYEILIDTLTGAYLPAYTKKMKRRTKHHPKFYFHDVGIVNYLARRRQLDAKTPSFGKAFENWVHHELCCFIKYSRSDIPLAYWQLTTGVEVDFIIGDMQIAIEAKATERVHTDHLKHLRELKKDFPNIKERLVVSLERHVRKTDDGIVILPYRHFIERLWSNALDPYVELRFS